MKIRKSYRIIFRVSLASVAAAAVITAGLWIGLSFLVPADFMKKTITSFFMENFSKAVIFDSASVSPFGTVKLVNFAMAKEADFNDNIDLIRCKEVDLDVSLASLVRKKIRIRSVRMDGAKIQIVKNSSISYTEFIKSVIQTRKSPADLAHHELKEVSVSLRDATLVCREVCVTDSATVSISDLSLDLEMKSGNIGFSASGTVAKGKTGWIDEGSVSVEGSCMIPADSSPCSGAVHIAADDFDISVLSPVIRDMNDSVTDVEGGAGADIRFRCFEGSWSVSGRASLESFSATKKKNETERTVLVSDEKLSSSFVIEKLLGNKLVVRSFTLDNGAVSVSCEGTRTAGSRTDSVETSFSVQSSDIQPVFDKYRFLKEYETAGVLNVRAHLGFDFAAMTDDIVDVLFSLTRIETENIKKAGMKLTASRQDIRTHLEIDGKDSDLKLDSVTGIQSWGDLSSRTAVDASSKTVDGNRLGSYILGAVNTIYGGAWDDRKRGYEDIRFLLTPYGRILPANDISLKWSCGSISMGKASLKNAAVALSLTSGRLSTDQFSLSGYNGTYQFRTEGVFNIDFPMFKAEASFDNVDIGAALTENGVSGVTGGTLSGALTYSMNGNRASHIVDNGTIDARLDLRNMNLSNASCIDRFYTWFNANGIKSKPAALAISRIGFAYKQAGENAMFTELGMTGDLLSFTGYGKYHYTEGLKIALPSAVFSTKNADGSVINETAPFNLTGRLCSPVLSIDRKNASGDLILYKID